MATNDTKKNKYDMNALGAGTQIFTNFVDDLKTKGMVESETGTGNKVFSPSQFALAIGEQAAKDLGPGDSLQGLVNPNIKSPTAIAERATLGGFDVTKVGGTPEQKMQGGSGGFSLPNTDFSGVGAGSTNMEKASLGAVDITKTPGINPQDAAGITLDGDTMTYRSPTGGTATMSGPGVGKVNWDAERLNKGVSSIGDWAGEEAKASMHQAGLNRLRAGLPYDAKEAAAMQSQIRERQDASNMAWLEKQAAQTRQDELLKRIDNTARNFESQADWVMRGSNPRARLAESLYEKAAAIRGGAYGQAIAGNSDVEQAGVTGRAALGAAEMRQGRQEGQLTAKDIFDMQFKQKQLENEDRRFGLDVAKAGEQMGTERARLGLTEKENEAQNFNRMAQLRVQSAKQAAELWANPSLNRDDVRRQAASMRTAAGMNPLEASFETLMEDKEARDAIEAGTYEKLTDAYPVEVVNAYRQQIAKQRVGYTK